MTITAIEIKNIKGIDHKQFKLQLMPYKPNLLVAPNGFGKSSIATAFASMNSQRLTLADKDHYKGDISSRPELSIAVNGQTLTANDNTNEIRPQFDVTVIRSGLVPKATKRKIGGFTQATASLEIESILIRKIPQKLDFAYQTSRVRNAFGRNGKILPNITSLFQNTLLCEAFSNCNLGKLFGKRFQQSMMIVIDGINKQNGTAEQICQWITNNQLDDFRAIPTLCNLANNLCTINLATSETEAFLSAYQIAELYKADSKSFEAALGWLQYTAERKYYGELLQSLCSSNWQWAELNEDKKAKKLLVVFPQAHHLSNGQRDVLTLVVQMHKALYEGSKKPLILVIDEVFDYLDDANLVAFQYYVTCLIEEYKQRDQIVYPIILTHLDPGVFFDFCFNRHKIQTHYLLAIQSGKSKNSLKLIEARDNENAIKDRLEKYWFHFHSDTHEIDQHEWPCRLPGEWRKSDTFQNHMYEELQRYLENKKYDPLAVCIAVRVTIEKKVHNLLGTEAQKVGFLSTHKTREKLNFAASHIVDIPEIYFLLGLIYNTSLHWKQGKDYVSPLVARLNHPTIKKLIQQATT